jgi:hypothetical protein
VTAAGKIAEASSRERPEGLRRTRQMHDDA